MRVPAVVGSFPEPFVHGIDGRRLPVRVECTEARGRACTLVSERLGALGVVAARGGLQRSLTKDTLRVLVGPWGRLRADETAALLEDGPGASGVYARPARDGRSIAALDEDGRVTRTLRAGTGIVAATRLRDNRPVWIVSGTDESGRARRSGDALRDRARQPLRDRGGRPARPGAARRGAGGGVGVSLGYRRLASPLHAARAAAGGAYCIAIAGAALATSHPLLLAALAACVAVAAAGAGVGRDVARAARLALVLGVLIAAVNALVSRQGLTVFARLGEVPPLGQVDLTVEALVYGALLGARIVVVVCAFALFTASVDPDEVLMLFRRVSLRSALTAALATRMVPVLARDARRLDEARRCRPDGGGSGAVARAAVVRAVATGALDRAIDVAATLEVRGYGTPARAGGANRAPWSRHDVAFAAAAVAIAALVGATLVAGGFGFEAYPLVEADVGVPEMAVGVALCLVGALPFADRRGIER